jgi:2-polyprenyl-3-methyl-5-hydroxy-6-metoxy-1,4-benzoquinol methylase
MMVGMSQPDPPDREAVDRFALKVWQYKQGEVVSLMVHLGDRLGLYRAMDGAGWLTPAELAARAGLAERWVREWLRGQAAAGLVDADEAAATFALGPEGALVLAREEDSLSFAAGAFGGGMAPPAVVDALAEAFRTGVGLTFDQLGRVSAHRVARQSGPWARMALVQRVIPALDGVEDRLRAGARVLEVGCGGGLALLAMAGAYPASRFEGVDLSRFAIEHAERAAAESGLENVTFRAGRGEELAPDAAHDLVMTMDCLHDMTRPDLTAAAIRGAIRPDGTWLIREIRSSGDWSRDRRNPLLAMFYGYSVASCMSSALSEPGGAGLGTLGLPGPAVEALCRAAGFGQVVSHDLDDPANLYYEARI